MKVTRLYINGNTNRVLSPTAGSNTGNWLWLTRGDLATLQVQMVNNDLPSIDPVTGYASAADAFSLSDVLGGMFGIKTVADAAAGGDWQQVFATFATSQTWHNINSGRFAMPYALERTLDATIPYIVGLATNVSANTRGHMTDLPINARILPDIYTQSESNGPSVIVSPIYSGTIAVGADSVAITVDGMTAAGEAIPYFVGTPTQIGLAATPGTGAVTVSVGGPVEVSTLVKIYVTKKS